ncbi:MAG: hypothetical protein JXD22_13190 [Sedimentisphaerales bacterium]|nr:hypothetical protein [Sedimentisphaerales bacterium]
MCETLSEQFTKTDEGMKLYQQERIIFEVSELICKLMEDRKINKVKLAAKLGRSKGYITQLLDGSANMTLRTISDVMMALDSSLYVEAGPLSIEAHDPQINYRIEKEEYWNTDQLRESLPCVPNSSGSNGIKQAG